MLDKGIFLTINVLQVGMVACSTPDVTAFFDLPNPSASLQP
jgi:hypothetical protein